MSSENAPPIGVLGIGLIGGSFALALKRSGRKIVAVDSNSESCKEALARGVADEAATDASVLAGCAAVLIATPPGATGDALRAAAAAGVFETAQAVFDAGSIKQKTMKEAESILGARYRRFVACHPIAGTEFSGVTAAVADLFENRLIVACPDANTDPDALARTEELWRACGGKIERMDAAEHDRLFASVSHLPHLLAYALVNSLFNSPDAAMMRQFAASGFRDFTRIASSNPDMWRDICLHNSANIIAALDRYRIEIDGLRKALQEQDAEKLHTLFSRVRNLRNSWLADQDD